MMRNRLAPLLSFVLLSLCSCAVAAPPVDTAQDPVREANARGTEPAAADSRSRYLEPLPRDASYLSTQDYSPRALYMEAHGDFTAKMERFEPMIQGSLAWLPSSSLKGKSGEFDQTWVKADAKVPFISGTDTELTLGGFFDARRFETDSTFQAIPDETVYAAGIHVGASHFAEDDLLLSAEVSPGAYSDMDGTLTRHDWQFNGHALATYRHQEDLFFKGGVMWSQDFKHLGAFPLAGLSWLFHPRWRVDVLLPKKIEVSWNPDPAIILHTGLELEGNRYRVHAPLSAGKTTSDLWAQELNLTVGGIYRFNDNISMFGRVGGALAGDYTFSNTIGQRVNGTLDPTFLFEIGFGIDF